jgi:hypothetical protein
VCVVNGQPCPGVGKNRPWWWLRVQGGLLSPVSVSVRLRLTPLGLVPPLGPFLSIVSLPVVSLPVAWDIVDQGYRVLLGRSQ